MVAPFTTSTHEPHTAEAPPVAYHVCSMPAARGEVILARSSLKGIGADGGQDGCGATVYRKLECQLGAKLAKSTLPVTLVNGGIRVAGEKITWQETNVNLPR